MPFKMFSETAAVQDRADGVCVCNGMCPGYGTRSNCPPLIVLAVLAVSQAALSHGVVKLLS